MYLLVSLDIFSLLSEEKSFINEIVYKKELSKMKKGKGLAAVLIGVMLIVSIVLVIMMITGGRQETYYGYMKNSTTADKVISEESHEIEENVKLPTEDDFSPKQGDFVKLVKTENDSEFKKMEVVEHDDVPHGLMMKIHDMHGHDSH